jgi:SIR2-like domain
MTGRETNIDIGNFSKRVLLTGAGWTRNWGGKLATEVWQDLIGSRSVQSNSRLRELLLREPSFEEALGQTLGDSFTDAARETFQQALLDVFVGMDREIARHDQDPWINIYKVQELVYTFWKGNVLRVDTGFIFTLNQDLWPERRLFNEIRFGVPKPILPGLSGRQNQQFFTSAMEIGSRDLTMEPVDNPARTQLRGNLNLVKLHGSFNWRTAENENMMVVGTEKTAQIAAWPLLTWYSEIFKSVLSAGSVRLMIVGYGFADEHVNAVIADAIEHHDLKIFIWDT